MPWMKLWIMIFLTMLSEFVCADTVTVAVAANFTQPMQQIAHQFEKISGDHVILVFGSTGNFYAQIKAGAPFEVLLAADEQTPTKLEQEHLGVAGSRFTYAVGKLVLWSAQPKVVDAEGRVLQSGAFAHLALANPHLAPYGAAAMQTLQSLQLLPALQAKLVEGESIAQAYQFIATGNATLGFVALSQVMAQQGQSARGSMWVVPAADYTPLRQDAILLQKGRNDRAAVALLAFLHSPAAQHVIRSFGYDLGILGPHDAQ